MMFGMKTNNQANKQKPLLLGLKKLRPLLGCQRKKPQQNTCSTKYLQFVGNDVT